MNVSVYGRGGGRICNDGRGAVVLFRSGLVRFRHWVFRALADLGMGLLRLNALTESRKVLRGMIFAPGDFWSDGTQESKGQQTQQEK